jgi:ABC-type branched-subunit amino acid transport system substrate-binding protein
MSSGAKGQWMKICCVAIATALIVAACGSSSKPTTSGTTATTTGSPGGSTASTAAPSATTGTTIKLMALGQFQNSQFAFPESLSGIQARVDSVNATGGINGSKIDLIPCNDAGDPNVTAACARTAVSDHVAAVIAGFSNFGPNSLPILQQASIPYINSELNTPTDLTNPMVFSADGGVPAGAFGIGAAAVANGCKKVGVLAANNPSGALSAKEIAAAVKANGGVVTTSISEPLSIPDYSSPVQQLVSSGAQCIGIEISPTNFVEFFSALHDSSAPTTTVVLGAGLTTPLESQLHGLDNGSVQVSSPYLPGQPQTAQFTKEMQTWEPKAARDSFSISAWAGTLLFTDIAAKLQTVNNTNVLAALQQLKSIDLGVYPPVSFQPNPVTSFARLTNTKVFAYKYDNGNYTLLPGMPLDIQSSLQGAGSSV